MKAEMLWTYNFPHSVYSINSIYRYFVNWKQSPGICSKQCCPVQSFLVDGITMKLIHKQSHPSVLPAINDISHCYCSVILAELIVIRADSLIGFPMDITTPQGSSLLVLGEQERQCNITIWYDHCMTFQIHTFTSYNNHVLIDLLICTNKKVLLICIHYPDTMY